MALREVGALEGLLVLDLSAYANGRYATMIFGDLGAEVIGIEMRPGGRKADFKMLDDDAHPRWLWHQRNKKSITLDLKTEGGLKVFMQLAAKADVVVESFRPGGAKKLGLDYEAVSKVNPKIIYCSISGYGQDGPYAHLANHEPNYQALSGVMDRNRLKGGDPHMHSGFIGDLVGGSLFAALSILAAVVHRNKTGEGQHIDVAMTAGLLPMLGYHVYSHQRPPTPRMFSTESPASNIVPEQSVYRTKDGQHIAISIPEPWLYKRACEELGAPELVANYMTDDPELSAATRKRLEEVFASKTRTEWEAFNNERDLGISPVKNLDEIFEDPQMRHRGMIIEYDYEPTGVVKHIGTPFIMSKTPANTIRNIPRYGEHTEQLLAELGYSEAEIEDLQDAGVF